MPNQNTTDITYGYQQTSSFRRDSGKTSVEAPFRLPRMSVDVARGGYPSRSGYHDRLAKGLHPGMNAFSYQKITTLHPTGWRRSEYDGIVSTSVGSFPMYSDGRDLPSRDIFTSEQRSKLDAELRTRVRLAIKDQKANWAVTAAEWQKTADMVTEAATSIYKAYGNLRRGNIAQAARDLGVTASKRGRRRFQRNYARNQADAVSSGWLELQYGWRPLISEVYGTAEFAAKQTVPSIHSRVQRSQTLEVSQSVKQSPRGYNEIYTYTGSLTCKYTVHFRVDGSLAPQAAQVGLTNPLLVAWELVPFSFVVDWFIPIGNALASLDATLGLVFEFGCVTTFEKVDQSVQREHVESRLEEHTMWGRQNVACTRQVLTNFPSPALPPVKNPVSVSNALSALALLYQHRGK